MIAVDTSVVVPIFATWHDAHAAATLVLAQEPRLPQHAAIEAYAVLTRLPVPHRAPPGTVSDFLDRLFPPPRRLAPEGIEGDVPRQAAVVGVTGGAVYDTLIALTVRQHGATLVTRDRRALRTYRAMGVEVALLD